LNIYIYNLQNFASTNKLENRPVFIGQEMFHKSANKFVQ